LLTSLLLQGCSWSTQLLGQNVKLHLSVTPKHDAWLIENQGVDERSESITLSARSDPRREKRLMRDETRADSWWTSGGEKSSWLRVTKRVSELQFWCAKGAKTRV